MFRPTLFRWQNGRQEGNYRIFPIIYSTRFKVDMHLIFYPTGSEIRIHKDPVMFTQRHYRLNLEIWRAIRGGVFNCSNCILRTRRLALFRPDLEEHNVTKIEEGCRVVFSIGWLRAPSKESLRDIKFD